GCGGGGPAGSTKRFGRIDDVTIRSSGELLPVKTVLRPVRLRSLNVWWMVGRRMSPSTSRTLPPFCANTIAVLMLVVVLPSCGRALVTMMIFGAAPIEDSRIEVRSARYDSATSDFGRACASRLTVVLRMSLCACVVSATDAFTFLLRAELMSRLSGIMPSDGNPESDSTCSGV